MAVMPVTELRKVVSKNDIPAGVYSGTITGYVATFKIGYDTFECLLMQASTRANQPCQVVMDNSGVMTVNSSN